MDGTLLIGLTGLVALVLLVVAAYAWGHAVGYDKGERDQRQADEFLRRVQGRERP